MKMRKLIRIVVLVVIGLMIIVGITFFLRAFERAPFHRPVDPVYASADYCYDLTSTGFSYHSVPSKRCICNGELIGVNACPGNADCAPGEIHCNGLVVGTEYVYSAENATFRTLGDFNIYCVKTASRKGDCLAQYNRTYVVETSALEAK